MKLIAILALSLIPLAAIANPPAETPKKPTISELDAMHIRAVKAEMSTIQTEATAAMNPLLNELGQLYEAIDKQFPNACFVVDHGQNGALVNERVEPIPHGWTCNHAQHVLIKDPDPATTKTEPAKPK